MGLYLNYKQISSDIYEDRAKFIYFVHRSSVKPPKVKPSIYKTLVTYYVVVKKCSNDSILNSKFFNEFKAGLFFVN